MYYPSTQLSKAQREQFVWMLQHWIKKVWKKNLVLGMYTKVPKK